MTTIDVLTMAAPRAPRLLSVCVILALLGTACARQPPPDEPDPWSVVEPLPPTPPLLVSHAAADHTCALDGDGMATCWGRHDRGQLGGDPMAARARVPFTGRFEMIVVGGHTCGLDRGGQAFCWGPNEQGQLGDGTTTDRAAPTPVVASQQFTRISAGAAHTCALDPDGRAFCWGDNTWGQLGDGTRTDSPVPVPAADDSLFARLAAGSRHTCGITAAGGVACWGDNFLGQLGLPRAVNLSLEPLTVPGPSDVVAISAGHGHTCALGVRGEGWCWGQNGIGQLGSGAPPGSYRPVRVVGTPPLADLRVGYHHTCAVDTDGNGWCWGANTPSQPRSGGVSGQLGGDLSWSNLPVRIGLARPLRALAPGDGHTCALTRAGVIFCFGNNRFGQLGRPAPAHTSEPIRVRSVVPAPEASRSLPDPATPATVP